MANWTPPSVTRTLRRIVNFNHTDHHYCNDDDGDDDNHGSRSKNMITLSSHAVETAANMKMMMAMFDALSNVRVWRLDDRHARMAQRAT